MKKTALSSNIELLMEHYDIKNKRQLAQKLDMPQTTVNKLLSGISSDPHISTLIPIANYFNVGLDDLLSDDMKIDSINTDQIENYLIPLVNYDELPEVYEDLTLLTNNNWPHWYPVPKLKTEHPFALQITNQNLAKPFDDVNILIVNNNFNLSDDEYFILKHIESNSINIKKIMSENGKNWLLALQPEIPAIEFNENEWSIIGCIESTITNITNKDFFMNGEKI